MLRDEYGEEVPLPQDQSLYYLQQLLEGVNFVHQSGYLHLDIKGMLVYIHVPPCMISDEFWFRYVNMVCSNKHDPHITRNVEFGGWVPITVFP